MSAAVRKLSTQCVQLNSSLGEFSNQMPKLGENELVHGEADRIFRARYGEEYTALHNTCRCATHDCRRPNLLIGQ